MNEGSPQSRWVALITGTISVVIGLVYLVLITFLDARGPMQPPPPEALGGEVVVVDEFSAEALQPFEMQSLKTS